MKKREILKKNDLSFVDKMTNQEKMKVKGGKVSANADQYAKVSVTTTISF